MAQFVKINAMGPDPCDECEDLDGEVVTRQYWRAHTHPNCKCVAVPVTKADMTKAEKKVAEKMKAKNMEADEEVQAPEVQNQAQDVQKQIDENGEIDVQVSVVGAIDGSDTEGNPIPQNITQDALEAIAQGLNTSGEEVLVDTDHQSAKAGLERNTRAAGWLSRFWTTTKGLFAKMKLTPHGKEVVEGREYRKLSPVFTLDAEGKPTSLVSAALTNQPAMQDIEPILNQKPNEALKMEITKEDLVTLIKETVASMNEQPKEEQPVEAENACGTEAKEEAANEEAATDAPTEAPAEQDAPSEPETPAEQEASAEEQPAEAEASTEDKKEEEQPKEVIQEAALNQKPTQAPLDNGAEWRHLHGEEFFKWARNHRM